MAHGVELLGLVAVVVAGLGVGPAWADCSCAGVLPPDHVAVPCLCIPPCKTGAAIVDRFTPFAQAGTGPVPWPAGSGSFNLSATVCHAAAGITLKWSVEASSVQSRNCGVNRTRTCDQCRDQVWQGDAVEFYLTDNLRDRRQNVTEIDISPVGAGLWASYIDNPAGYFPEQPAVPIACGRIGVSKTTTSTGWAATLALPWAVLTQRETVPTLWRSNLYGWSYKGGSSGSAESSTGTPFAWSVPHCDNMTRCNAEHVPKYFGVVKLVGSGQPYRRDGSGGPAETQPESHELLQTWSNERDKGASGVLITTATSEP